jgi:hypothetical protein
LLTITVLMTQAKAQSTAGAFDDNRRGIPATTNREDPGMFYAREKIGRVGLTGYQ